MLGAWVSADIEITESELVCLDHNGNVIWQTRPPFAVYNMEFFNEKIMIPVGITKQTKNPTLDNLPQQYMTFDYNGNYLGIRDFNSNVKLFDNTYLSFDYHNKNGIIITEYNANGEYNFSVTLNNNSVYKIEKTFAGDYIFATHPNNDIFDVSIYIITKNGFIKEVEELKEYKKYIKSKTFFPSITAICKNREGDIYLFINSQEITGISMTDQHFFIKLDSQYNILGIWKIQYDIEPSYYNKFYVDKENILTVISTNKEMAEEIKVFRIREQP
jgi:hypothetical protein